MNQPRFSVIMPLYNKAPYVRKAVESVVGQSYGDWELWIVDDGSTDGSENIAKSLTDQRIHLVQQENTGVSMARNNGVAASHGEYLCFLDADDWWEPTFLEGMSGLIERHPDAGIYGTGYYIVKNGKRRIAPIGVDKDFTEGDINYCQVYAKTLCMPLTSISVCIPRAMFNEIDGFPTNIRLGEDFLLWIHIALKHKVVLLNKPLSNYNQDVDITYRGTHHLHDPKHHMLWNLDDLESFEQTIPDYKQLIDNLRTYSLLPYLITKQYRKIAQQEMAKIDWSRQSSATRRLYRMPVFYLKLRTQLLKLGSTVKQHILNHV